MARFFILLSPALVILIAASSQANQECEVFDSNGNPAAGTLANAMHWDEETCDMATDAEATADANGKLSLPLDKLPKTPLSFMLFRHPDHGVVAFNPWYFQRQSSSPLRVVLPGKTTIEGMVKDAAGKSVAEAIVCAALSTEGHEFNRILPPCEQAAKALTGSDGRFVLEGLPEGRSVVLRARHAVAGIGIEGQPYWPDPHSKVATGSKDVVVTLKPFVTLQGRIVIEASGQPAEGATVHAYADLSTFSGSFFPVAPMRTASDGRFSFRALAEVPYMLNAKVDDLAARCPCLAGKEGVTEAPDLMLVKKVLVSGRIVDKSGLASFNDEDARVQVSRIDWNTDPVELKPDGAFSVRSLPGLVTLTVFSSRAKIPKDGKEKRLVLEKGKDWTDVTFELLPPPMFKGKVVGVDGAPMTGAIVKWYGMGMNAKIATAAGSAFQVPMPEIDFTRKDLYTFDATLPDKAEMRGMLFKYLTGEQDMEGDIQMAPTGAVHGKVVDMDAKAMPNYTVSADLHPDARYFHSDRQASSDALGNYKIGGLLTTIEYEVHASLVQNGLPSRRGSKSVKTMVAAGQDLELEDLVVLPPPQVSPGSPGMPPGTPRAPGPSQVRVPRASTAIGGKP